MASPRALAAAASSPPASNNNTTNNIINNPHHDPAARDGDDDNDAARPAAAVPVETLVEHLLAAKRSLSSMTLVLRANGLSTRARQLHEEAVVLRAQTAFLRRGIADQTRLLMRVRRSLVRTYDAAKRDFKALIKTLDDAHNGLESTMDMLRSTAVDPNFRPAGEEPKNLLDFVDETQVDGLREALKASINELQATQTSFDGDLFRFENDIRALTKALSTTSPSPHKSPADSGTQNNQRPLFDLLASMAVHSHSMAERLTELTQHFDKCVTAVRITEGGAALARTRAAEDPGEADPVSLSGVMAEQEASLDAMDAADKAEFVQMVMEDASVVDEVLADLHDDMHDMEADFGTLTEHADQVRGAHAAVAAAFAALEDIGARLPGYIAAETEFVDRWEAEKEGVFARLDAMERLRDFYEGYASAYDSLVLEVERRRAVEERIHGIWRKARDAVDKLVEADCRDRETFRAEVGEYIPTDLWAGMGGPLKRWEVVVQAGDAMPRLEDGSAVTLSREGVDAARDRIRRGLDPAPGR